MRVIICLQSLSAVFISDFIAVSNSRHFNFSVFRKLCSVVSSSLWELTQSNQLKNTRPHFHKRKHTFPQISNKKVWLSKKNFAPNNSTTPDSFTVTWAQVETNISFYVKSECLVGCHYNSSFLFLNVLSSVLFL